MEAGSLSLTVAFAAGLLSFLSPCVLPLVPAYIGHLGGASISEIRGVGARARTLMHAVAFVSGFSLVFTVFWVSLGAIGYVLPLYLDLIRQIGGVVLIVFGLHVLGVFHIPLLYAEKRFHLDPTKTGRSLPVSFLIGMLFAAGWTPCIGPTLGGIIGLASQSDTVLDGARLLIAYSAGLAVPFLLTALLLDRMLPLLRAAQRHMRLVTGLQGVFLIVVGVLMLTNSFILLPQYFDWGQY